MPVTGISAWSCTMVNANPVVLLQSTGTVRPVRIDQAKLSGSYLASTRPCTHCDVHVYMAGYFDGYLSVDQSVSRCYMLDDRSCVDDDRRRGHRRPCVTCLHACQLWTRRSTHTHTGCQLT